MSLTRRALLPRCAGAVRWSTVRTFASTTRRFDAAEPTAGSPSTPSPSQPSPSILEDTHDDRPRWTHTPERMKAPFSLQQPRDPSRSIWQVNEDPERLDRMYEKLLGPDLARTLPDDLKWLAVTHKSFDNGRRGFNTRLAFYGRMILALETTNSIMTSDISPNPPKADPYGREPFTSPAIDNLDKLNNVQPHDFSTPEKMAALAKEVGLLGVIQWKPRLPKNLEGSGVNVVLTSTVFAIIGAVSLHYGGDVAGQVVRERILKRLQ